MSNNLTFFTTQLLKNADPTDMAIIKGNMDAVTNIMHQYYTHTTKQQDDIGRYKTVQTFLDAREKLCNITKTPAIDILTENAQIVVSDKTKSALNEICVSYAQDLAPNKKLLFTN